MIKIQYSLTRDLGRTSGNYSVAIYNTVHMNRDVNESGFPFQFTCNNDERVYYNGYFLKQVVKMRDFNPDRIRGYQIYYNIDLMDCEKLSRDFKNITENDIQNIIDQLMPLCIERINDNMLNNSGLLFNVNVL